MWGWGGETQMAISCLRIQSFSFELKRFFKKNERPYGSLPLSMCLLLQTRNKTNKQNSSQDSLSMIAKNSLFRSHGIMILETNNFVQASC
jgi:hypothetical protein